MSELALGWGHFLYRQTVPGFGNEMPIGTLVALELELGLALLLIIERGEKLRRRLSHFVGGLMSERGERPEQHEGERCGEECARNHASRSKQTSGEGKPKIVALDSASLFGPIFNGSKPSASLHDITARCAATSKVLRRIYRRWPVQERLPERGSQGRPAFREMDCRYHALRPLE